MTSDIKLKIKCLCGGDKFKTIFVYNEPPSGEISFDFSKDGNYCREIKRCDRCGHYTSWHDMDTSSLYEGDYVNSNYGESGLKKTFNKINALDSLKSDNVGRVKCVVDYASKCFNDFENKQHRSVLDIGSGLCVFLYRMKELGWDCTALDPDIRSINHAKDVVAVKTIHGDFMKVENIGTYDVITLNRVLEHVETPGELLEKGIKYLKPNGFIYVEVPDGEMAVVDGKEREEFSIDHIHIFSMESLLLLVKKSGFDLKTAQRLRDPSGKYTLRVFITPIK